MLLIVLFTNKRTVFLFMHIYENQNVRMEHILLLLLLLNEEENYKNSDRTRYIRSLRDPSNSFSLSANTFMQNFRLTREICSRLVDDYLR